MFHALTRGATEKAKDLVVDRMYTGDLAALIGLGGADLRVRAFCESAHHALHETTEISVGAVHRATSHGRPSHASHELLSERRDDLFRRAAREFRDARHERVARPRGADHL